MLNARIALAVLLGAWAAGTLFMWMVATQNFAVVETIRNADNAEFRRTTEALSPDELRLAMRYQASENNRLFFNGWAWMQLPLAAIAATLAWRGRYGKFILGAAAAMLAITLFLTFYVVPETVRLGRLIDFAPRDPPPPAEAKFWLLHHTYTGLDMIKFLLAAGCCWVLARDDERTTRK